MSSLIPARPTSHDRVDVDVQERRGSTLEEAMMVARLAFGREITLREADRMRRGGLGGFFASEVDSIAPTFDNVLTDVVERRADLPNSGQSIAEQE